MNMIKIAESDNAVVRYDKDRGMYVVSVFEDGCCKYEIWFDAYEEKETSNTNYLNAIQEIQALNNKVDDLEMQLEYYNDW